MASTRDPQLPPEIWAIVFTHLFRDHFVKVKANDMVLEDGTRRKDVQITTNANTSVMFVSK